MKLKFVLRTLLATRSITKPVYYYVEIDKNSPDYETLGFDPKPDLNFRNWVRYRLKKL